MDARSNAPRSAIRGSSLAIPNANVRRWLVSICALIVAMVTIGGITRLTGSGLSITEWKPILGAIPPLHTADWERAFALYRQSPQYQVVNSGMSLESFKWIFFWEYFHRLVGRAIGVLVLVPGVYFFFRGLLSRALLARIAIGFAFGGFQGALGWFMVVSGLSDLPAVSHFRLAAHFSLALCLLAYFTHVTLAYSNGELSGGTGERSKSARFPLGRTSNVFRSFTVALAVQIVYGAFVAGLKAGHGFNTFPLMAGEFFPSNGFALEPAWLNAFENPTTIQWIHRTVGWILFFSGCLFIRESLRTRDVGIRSVTHALGACLIAQFILGVATLLSVVALPLAVLHQFGAAIIVVLWTRTRYRITRAATDSISEKNSPLKGPSGSETLEESWNQ